MALVRRLAVHYPHAVIAGLLTRPTWATYVGIGIYPALSHRPNDLRASFSISNRLCKYSVSPIHRWLNDGFVAGEPITAGAPWRIRLTDELTGRFVETAPTGYVPMQEATKLLGVSPPDGVTACKAWRTSMPSMSATDGEKDYDSR